MRYATILLCFFVHLLLGGCSTQPSVDGTSPQGMVAGAAAAPGQQPPGNPYLDGRGSVPADAQRQFEQARLLIEAGNWQGALLTLQALSQAYPRLSGPSLDLALVYQQLGDTEQAQRWFQQSIANNPGNIAAYNEYGIFLRKQGRFKEAETVYLKALDEWEASADTHRDIGILYDLYLGESGKALQHYHRYQTLTGEQDHIVADWIADLERQQVPMAKGGQP
jgi:tetratricopeptide (TPR) repeat protein